MTEKTINAGTTNEIESILRKSRDPTNTWCGRRKKAGRPESAKEWRDRAEARLMKGRRYLLKTRWRFWPAVQKQEGFTVWRPTVEVCDIQ